MAPLAKVKESSSPLVAHWLDALADDVRWADSSLGPLAGEYTLRLDVLDSERLASASREEAVSRIAVDPVMAR